MKNISIILLTLSVTSNTYSKEEDSQQINLPNRTSRQEQQPTNENQLEENRVVYSVSQAAAAALLGTRVLERLTPGLPTPNNITIIFPENN
jgi:hypothetical protein